MAGKHIGMLLLEQFAQLKRALCRGSEGTTDRFEILVRVSSGLEPADMSSKPRGQRVNCVLRGAGCGGGAVLQDCSVVLGCSDGETASSARRFGEIGHDG